LIKVKTPFFNSYYQPDFSYYQPDFSYYQPDFSYLEA
jgi:hypothetical protein